jgi:hypothetical protein
VALTPTEATRLSHDWIADINFFDLLCAEDARIAAAVKVAGCRRCGGRLDRADYPRKPRGGAVAGAGEGIERRLSFCCSREGCRRRTTPPSLVFLGRRVYLAITVVTAAWRSVAAGVPHRTVRRWQTWFAELRSGRWITEIAGRLWPPVEPGEKLPDGLVQRFEGRPLGGALAAVLQLLAPLSTGSA